MIRIVDQLFARYRLGATKVEQLTTGFRWSEGPVWIGDGHCLLWSDIPNNRIMRSDEETGRTTVFRKPSNFANDTRDNRAVCSRTSTARRARAPSINSPNPPFGVLGFY